MTLAPAGRTTLLALALFSLASPAHAQLGGLIKKKIEKAAGTAPQAATQQQPVKFDDVVIELTPERVAKVIAGKKAGRTILDGPDGPPALRTKLEVVDGKQAAIYEKHVGEINAWDIKRRERESCRDSIFQAHQGESRERFRSQAMSNPGFRQKLAEKSMAMMTAQQKGDTAAVRRLREEIQRLSNPSPSGADTLTAMKVCGDPNAPPPLVAEYLSLMDQKKLLEDAIVASEDAIIKAEEKSSGLTRRQLYVACERFVLYLDRQRKKQLQTGISIVELQALQDQIDAMKQACEKFQ